MKHLIISCTKKERSNTILFRSLTALQDIIELKKLVEPEIKFEFIENNTRGLSKNYNECIEKYKDKYDSLVFIHDDVELTKPNFLRQLENAYDYFDIVGLAGCLDPEIKRPILWHLMSSELNRRGRVGHVMNNEKFITDFGPSNCRVCIIDGLFMAFKTESIKKSGFRLDESFDFHHYDTSVGLIANELKLKVGVWDIPVYHLSPGLFDYNNLAFQISQDKFLEKYG